ncbi:MAG: PDZ domain-containing protein [Chitinophagaceae bacterium]
MRTYFLKAICLMGCVGILSANALSQEKTERWNDNDEIIIKRKGDKNTKVTVEINDDEVKVNGKPLSEYDDENVVVRKRRSVDAVRAYSNSRSPFRGGNWNVDGNDFGLALKDMSNKAMLGVVTQKDDNGAKISSVSKGSAAEKAGLKEGDVITRLNDADIKAPEDLIKAVDSYKPDEKVTLTYKRDKKEQKTSVTLGKRTGAYGQELFEFNKDFDFNLATPGRDGFNMNLNAGNPRLGIRAQDTDDGKGVKVLDVDDGSNAGKAGIKEGDIIMEFDGQAVNNASELVRGAKEAREKSSVKVKLQRNGKSQEVEIKVPKKLKTATL